MKKPVGGRCELREDEEDGRFEVYQAHPDPRRVDKRSTGPPTDEVVSSKPDPTTTWTKPASDKTKTRRPDLMLMPMMKQDRP